MVEVSFAFNRILSIKLSVYASKRVEDMSTVVSRHVLIAYRPNVNRSAVSENANRVLGGKWSRYGGRGWQRHHMSRCVTSAPLCTHKHPQMLNPVLPLIRVPRKKGLRGVISATLDTDVSIKDSRDLYGFTSSKSCSTVSS